MTIKDIKPFKTLCFTCQTSLAEVGKYVRIKAREIHQSAIDNHFEITGPVYWIYEGMDGNPATQFQLQICVPVFTKSSFQGPFEIKEFSNFRCISEIHNGRWTEMYKTYGEIIGNALQQGKTLTGISREIYINMDFENPDNNITEIQIGIN
jgi:effector-binding domain-containing protein